jgi:hypothetical protein
MRKRTHVAPALTAHGAEVNATKTEVRKVHTRTARAHRILGARGKRIHTWQLHDRAAYWG